MKQIKAILIGAGSRGSKAYAPYALRHPDEIRFIAVAEPLELRRKEFCAEHDIPESRSFESYEQLFDADIPADVAFVCTQDQLHLEPSVMALEKGYHLVLEKPIATNLADCEKIVAFAKGKNRELIVCHVLRYTNFYKAIKKIISSGELGDIVSIDCNENVGYAHACHSYVRGNWRNEELSSPMILAKSCHDMDIVYWLLQDRCTKVHSFGSLGFFTPDNAPDGAGKRCLINCRVKESCPFDAEKIYMDSSITGWPVNVITADLSPEGRRKALLEGPYGRCVFNCDNTVVDRQVVSLEFKNGAVVDFAMNSLSYDTNRTITVYGTKGQLTGKMEDNKIVKQIFGKQEETFFTSIPGASEYGHGGGDEGLMQHVVERINSIQPGHVADESDAIISHRICFAAEKSRHMQSVEQMG